MRVLLDENLPGALVADFREHDCSHVTAHGWAGIKNGELLAIAQQAAFQGLVTFDKALPRQQNIAAQQVAVLVLRPHRQGIRATRELMGDVLSALANIREGEVRLIGSRRAP